MSPSIPGLVHTLHEIFVLHFPPKQFKHTFVLIKKYLHHILSPSFILLSSLKFQRNVTILHSFREESEKRTRLFMNIKFKKGFKQQRASKAINMSCCLSPRWIKRFLSNKRKKLFSTHVTEFLADSLVDTSPVLGLAAGSNYRSQLNIHLFTFIWSLILICLLQYIWPHRIKHEQRSLIKHFLSAPLPTHWPCCAVGAVVCPPTPATAVTHHTLAPDT